MYLHKLFQNYPDLRTKLQIQCTHSLPEDDDLRIWYLERFSQGREARRQGHFISLTRMVKHYSVNFTANNMYFHSKKGQTDACSF